MTSKRIILATMLSLVETYGYTPLQIVSKEKQQTDEERIAKLEKAEAKRKKKAEKKIISEQRNKMNFEKLSESWEELKELRLKATSELKEVTIEKLNFLSDELEKFGIWGEVLIGVVDYFNAGNDDNKNDERVVLYWKAEKGYFFRKEIFICDVWSEFEFGGNVDTFEELEDMDRVDLKMLVKLLPAKIEWLTRSLQQEIVELNVFKNSLK